MCAAILFQLVETKLNLALNKTVFPFFLTLRSRVARVHLTDYLLFQFTVGHVEIFFLRIHQLQESFLPPTTQHRMKIMRTVFGWLRPPCITLWCWTSQVWVWSESTPPVQISCRYNFSRCFLSAFWVKLFETFDNHLELGSTRANSSGCLHCRLLFFWKDIFFRIALKAEAQDSRAQVTRVTFPQIRNGSSRESLQFSGCSLDSSLIVTSRGRWMWICFASNHENTDTGFNALYTAAAYRSYGAEKVPWKECQQVRFRCRNRECVEVSYRCDGINDCGCTGDGCDEDGCGGLNWSKSQDLHFGTELSMNHRIARRSRYLVTFFQGNSARLWCGLGVGFLTFVTMFLTIGLTEMYLKKRTAEKKLEKEKEIIARRSQNRQKLISATVLESTYKEDKLDVPNGREETLTPLNPPSPSKTSSASLRYWVTIDHCKRAIHFSQLMNVKQKILRLKV